MLNLENLAWVMMQDIINSDKWTPERCLYLIEQFVHCHPKMAEERKHLLDTMIDEQNKRFEEFKKQYPEFYKLMGFID